MRWPKILLIVFLILLAVAAGLAAWSGFFTTVEVKEKNAGPYGMIYLHHVGSYRHCYELKDSVKRELTRQDLPVDKAFILYHDNPINKAPENLESEVGCIVPTGDYDMQKLPAGFQYRELNPGHSMLVEFPHRNSFSLYAGILKAYSAFKDYREAHNYKESYSIEIFDINNNRIIFLMPVNEK